MTVEHAKEIVNRPYYSLGMDSLARLIRQQWDQIAYSEWRTRYGHDFPVFAVIDGDELKHGQQTL